MKTRVITALIILACVIPPLLFGGWLIAILISFIVIAGGIELLQMSEHHMDWPMIIKPLAIIGVFLLSLIDQRLQIPLMSILALSFLSIPVFTDRFHAKDAFLCIAYMTIFCTIASGFVNIYTTDKLFVWYIIIATYGCDTGAYFCGRFFGKHKLNVRISPKKTWEGAIGGWIIGAALSFLFAYYLIPSMQLELIICASLILAITSQIGDLAFSAIKRCFQVKDFSNLLPGHGGVLDRVDSLVFNFVCFNFILVVLTL